MTVDEVREYFGTLHRACVLLKIAPQNMTKWKAKGYLPLLQQYRVAELTEGQLMPDEVDPKVLYNQRRGREEKV